MAMKGSDAFPVKYVSFVPRVMEKDAGLGGETPQPDDCVVVCHNEMVPKTGSIPELSKFEGALVRVSLRFFITIENAFDDCRTPLLVGGNDVVRSCSEKKDSTLMGQ
jgi:hypothetical protein